MTDSAQIESATSIYSIPLEDLLSTIDIRLNKIEKAASLCFLRQERFVEGFSVFTELIKLCNEFFGEKGHIESTGLQVQFKAMSEKVKKNNLIGLVLCGINKWDTLICNYTTLNLSTIKLTIASITRTLIREYFSKHEVEQMCKNTPNFNVYYNANTDG
jgi:hypothetical protein